MSVAGPTVCELGQEIPLHFWTWMIHVSSCWTALLIMCTYTLTVAAVMWCCADGIFTFYSVPIRLSPSDPCVLVWSKNNQSCQCWIYTGTMQNS